jgi:ribonuclease T2
MNYSCVQWPGAYCQDSDHGCCVPHYGYPAEDFFVKNFITFDLATNKAAVRCENGSPFDINQVVSSLHLSGPIARS